MWSDVNDSLPKQETVLCAKQLILVIIYKQNIFYPSMIVSESLETFLNNKSMLDYPQQNMSYGYH